MEHVSIAVRVERQTGGYSILKGESMEVTAAVRGNRLELVSIDEYIPRNVLPDEGSVREWMAKYVRKRPWDCAFSGCRRKRACGEGELVRMTIEPVKYYDGWDVSHLECYGKMAAGSVG